ncbi:radical SAM protein [Streptomyces sp. Ncost-T10-10d]|uniref:B12-binding domain-containing radical SAM protein n=1 Tax=Streptomyces sp. Ncost-T10-10d TaxID=1839774 RepID=UPI00081E1F97|nr:radical SAM protein [Streptomyces sp. Ncost-T10-10d]SCF70233.1 Radical SAM superfamily enzyme YgiQ, UPF0313 family [Streptomyces sp. Ncost-T10-10d]
MNITIVFPPAADPSLPYGALPLLGAVLKRAGYPDVSLRDVNLEAFDDLWRPDALAEALHREDVPGRTSGTAAELIADIDAARAILRDPVDFYDPMKLLFAKRLFHLAGDLLSASHPRVRFGKYSYSPSSYDSYEEIEAAVRTDAGPLARYFETTTVPSLLAAAPKVIGLSVPYFSQLIPAFILADRIRAADPGIHLTFGGPVITWGKEVLMADGRFGRWMDSFFVGEADETFLHFVDALHGKRDLTAVVNMVRYVDGQVVSQLDDHYQLDLDWSPTPDFTMMPMDRYFAPKRIICLMPTRGCYFNKCAFCNYAFIKMTPYRMRSPQLIAEDVATIQKATGESVFSFESDVMLPLHLKQISEALITRGTDIKWHGVARFEKGMTDELFATMRRAGCVRLYMGMESANERVLEAMVKGTDRQRMSNILRMCSSAGISVEAGVFSGFPSETAEEADDTYRFVRDHRHVIARADVGTFRLLKGAPIADTPEKYGIIVLGDPKKRWYHLDFRHTAPQEVSDGAAAMERIQRLYPEVALIDVPEDILYNADVGPDAFRRFFAAAGESATPSKAVPDEATVALSTDCELQRVHVANSGAVHFDDPAAQGARPVFEVSRMTLTIAVDRAASALYPLSPAEEFVLRRLGEGPMSAAGLRAEIQKYAESGADPDDTVDVSLLDHLVAQGVVVVRAVDVATEAVLGRVHP